MDLLIRTTAPLVLFGGFLSIAVSGCGGDDDAAKPVTVERTVTVEKPPARQKRRRTPRESTETTPAPEFVNCDPNIQAKVETTTCPFAENVFWTYWTSGESSSPLPVWSPAAQASFNTACESDGTQVVCSTSDDGAVKFSQTAVDSYSQAQADAYANTHDLGPDPYEGLPHADSPPSGGDGGADSNEDCQGYDPCINPGSDVDCAAGSGDGPRYVEGPVYVSGADPYGLDLDGDGVACEYG